MSVMACSQLRVLSAELEELQGALKTHSGISPSGGGRLSRASSAYNETWEVNEALTSSLWSPVAWKHFLEMANQVGLLHKEPNVVGGGLGTQTHLASTSSCTSHPGPWPSQLWFPNLWIGSKYLERTSSDCENSVTHQAHAECLSYPWGQ